MVDALRYRALTILPLFDGLGPHQAEIHANSKIRRDLPSVSDVLPRLIIGIGVGKFPISGLGWSSISLRFLEKRHGSGAGDRCREIRLK